jgi:N utilization substance protein B
MSKARSRARRLAMQALYEWQMSGNAPLDILKTFLAEQNLKNTDEEYFRELFLNTVKYQAALDDYMMDLLDRPINEVDPVEVAILRIASYELAHRPDVPYKVVINEAIELAKTFGAEAGHKFVNGILDKVAPRLRAEEIQHARKR